MCLPLCWLSLAIVCNPEGTLQKQNKVQKNKQSMVENFSDTQFKKKCWTL